MKTNTAWNDIATIPIGVEKLVCRDGVDANTKATLNENGEWTISDVWWCQIEANEIKNDQNGVFSPTHWWD